MKFFDLFIIISNRVTCIDWCIANGLIPSECLCPGCGSEMSLDYNKGTLGQV